MFSIIFSSTMIDHLVLKLSIPDPGFLAKRNILQFSDNVERVVMIRNGLIHFKHYCRFLIGVVSDFNQCSICNQKQEIDN
jgi:hypothetical protein